MAKHTRQSSRRVERPTRLGGDSRRVGLAAQGLAPHELAIRNIYWNAQYVVDYDAMRASGTHVNRKLQYCDYWDRNTGNKRSVWVALAAAIIGAGADPLRTLFRLHRWSKRLPKPMQPSQAVYYCNKTENNWFLPTQITVEQERLAVCTTFSTLNLKYRANILDGRTERDSLLMAVREPLANELVSYAFGCHMGYPDLVEEQVNAAVNYYIMRQSELMVLYDSGIPARIKQEAAITRQLYYI